jgi:hypothetical protein
MSPMTSTHLTSSPLTPSPKRPLYGLPAHQHFAHDRDDDAKSTSSVSSSLSSGSLPSPLRAEKMTSHADVGRGYSTSTPSPLLSPNSNGPMSPKVRK